MATVNLKEEVYRRRAQIKEVTAETKMADFTEKVLLEITQEITDRYSDLVHAVAAGKREVKALENVINDVIVEKGILLGRDREQTLKLVLDNILGYGILQPLIDSEATDVFVNGPGVVYVRVNDKDVRRTDISFRSIEHLEQYIRSIMVRNGQKINHAEPLKDARDVKNSLRINAGIRPSARTPYIAIRKHTAKHFSTQDFYRSKTFTPEVLGFLKKAVKARMNILIAGPTGSGKTTLMRYLAQEHIPKDERIVVIEEEAELEIDHPNMVVLEAKKKMGEEDNNITMDDLVKNALRMGMRRIILGELRGKEAFTLLRAFGTGHDGGMTSAHSNDIYNAVYQLAVMMLYADTPLKYEHLKLMISQALDIIIYIENYRITQIAAVTGYDWQRGIICLETLYDTERKADGSVVCNFKEPSEYVKELFWRRGVEL
ncbi:MAG: CpaF family protein [Thermoanaerobacteraceae bacterium]|nr:CpaF family protein [Thermoanaerobacteraceae bacterium]